MADMKNSRINVVLYLVFSANIYNCVLDYEEYDDISSIHHNRINRIENNSSRQKRILDGTMNQETEKESCQIFRFDWINIP